MRVPARLLLAFLASTFAVAPAFATVADDLCAPAANPCIVQSKQINVTDGSVIDLGARDLILRSGSALTVLDQAPLGVSGMTLRAANVTLEGGTAIKGAGADIDLELTGNLAVLKSNSLARIDVSGPLPGTIEVNALGNVIIQGIIDAGAAAIDSDGGIVLINGLGISLPGTIDIHGGKGAGGGELTLSADGMMMLSGLIDATGGAGGDVECNAAGDLLTTAKFDLKATAGADDGGNLDLATDVGRIDLGGTIDMKGEAGGDGGGFGGILDVQSGDSLTITAAIDARGAAPDGQGGDLTFGADVDIEQISTILNQGQGQQGSGGSVEFDAERKITLGPIQNFGGGDGFGGTLIATAWCELLLPSGIGVNTGGLGGDNLLRSGGSVTIAGTLIAGTTNRVSTRTGGTVTITGTVNPNNPDDLDEIDDGLVPCGGFPTPGCGNNMLDTGETCDDNNTESCDGCSATCQTESCGNGTVDCGEVCDDGNTTSLDGCHGDCSRFDVVCGDDIQEGDEACDDGNTDACDGCSATCQVEACNNGVIECGEECDDGIPGGGPCDDDCKIIPPPNCGDGVPNLDEGEECDDGNDNDCDACSNLCRKNVCGNGRIDGANCPTPLEQCDDFNTNPCDGCDGSCREEKCGNGRLDCFEQCDGTDGCLPGICEQGEFCTSETPEEQPCIACSNDADCDPMQACGSSKCLENPTTQRKECTPVDPPVCDDGNVCTNDACDPLQGCVTTPKVCDDGKACNGSETCDPSQGCVSTILSCDDGDVCTDDSCDDASGCSHALRTGIALVSCRIGEVESLLADPTIPAKAKKKLAKAVKNVKTQLTAAGSSKPKKAKSGLKKAKKGITKLGTLVTKLGPQLPASVASDMSTAVSAASQAIAPLQ